MFFDCKIRLEGGKSLWCFLLGCLVSQHFCNVLWVFHCWLVESFHGQTVFFCQRSQVAMGLGGYAGLGDEVELDNFSVSLGSAFDRLRSKQHLLCFTKKGFVTHLFGPFWMTMPPYERDS